MDEFRISDKGPVFSPGKLICIGRNYAKHAKELGNALPEQPMVFLKPASALLSTGGKIIIPSMSSDVHREVELVCLIGKMGKNISIENALDHIAGYAVGLDMTARDVQNEAKSKGHPWTVAKGFDTFAPLGPFISRSSVLDPQNLQVELTVNGIVRQSGNTADMIFPVKKLIVWCSSIFTLMPGDLIYTGTPEGVSQIRAGDELEARIEGFPELNVGVRHP